MTDEINFPRNACACKQTGTNQDANPSESVARIASTGLSVFSVLSSVTQLFLSVPTSLHFFPFSHCPQGLCHHPFCCLGDVFHFSRLAGWWVWESVKGGGSGKSKPGSKQMTRDWSESCWHRLLWHWGPGWTSHDPRDLGHELDASPQHKENLRLCWPSAQVKVVRKRSVRSPGQWKWALPLFSSVVLGVMHRRQAAWDTWRTLRVLSLSLHLCLSSHLCLNKTLENG